MQAVVGRELDRWVSMVFSISVYLQDREMSYATGRDITAEKEREKLLRDAQDFARLALSAVGGVGVWTYDVGTVGTAVSPASALKVEPNRSVWGRQRGGDRQPTLRGRRSNFPVATGECRCGAPGPQQLRPQVRAPHSRTPRPRGSSDPARCACRASGHPARGYLHSRLRGGWRGAMCLRRDGRRGRPRLGRHHPGEAGERSSSATSWDLDTASPSHSLAYHRHTSSIRPLIDHRSFSSHSKTPPSGSDRPVCTKSPNCGYRLSRVATRQALP